MSFGVKALVCVSALALLVTGCKKEPAGQVVATVDGKEVTSQELEAEAQAANVPASADKKTVLPIILQRVIDRKLFAEAAEKKGLDKQPDYLVQKKRVDETILAQLYAKQQLQTISVPTASDVQKFIGDNPTMFADRARYTVDQIRFVNPGDMSKLKPLVADKTLDQVGASLTQLGIKFERGPGQLDSGAAPAAVMKRILSVPSGTPFVIPQGPLITVSVITGKTPIKVPDADATVIATNMLRQQNSAKSIDDQIKALRSSAKITYQPGYAPPAGTGADGSPPTGNGAAPAQ